MRSMNAPMLAAVCSALVLLTSFGGNHAAAEEADGFVPLFNGKNLDGWQGATDVYVVEDGKLVCRKHGPGEQESTHQNLFTTKEYADFTLRFEFKLEPGANNGVAVRAPMDKHVATAGMEIQILDDTADQYKNLAPQMCIRDRTCSAMRSDLPRGWVMPTASTSPHPMHRTASRCNSARK